MRTILLFGIFLLTFLPPARAQRNFKFSNRISSAAAEDPNYFSGTFALGGFGLGYSLGVEYERIIGPRGLFSFQLPLGFMRSDAQFLSVAGDGDRFHYHRAMFLAPGVFYHPAGAFRRADFSMGLQLAAGPVNTRELWFTSGTTKTQNYSSIFVAPMAKVNINIRGKWSNSLFGWHFAAGPALSGNYGIDYNGRTVANPLFVQIGLRVGGTF